MSEAIGQEMDRDPSVLVLGEDIGRLGGVFGTTLGLLEARRSEQEVDKALKAAEKDRDQAKEATKIAYRQLYDARYLVAHQDRKEGNLRQAFDILCGPGTVQNPFANQDPSVGPVEAFIPLGPSDDATVDLGRRFIEAGPRRDDRRHTTYRGVLGFENGANYLGGAQRVITSAVESASPAQRREPALFKEHLRVELKRYIQKQTGAKPVILPVVVEV